MTRARVLAAIWIALFVSAPGLAEASAPQTAQVFFEGPKTTVVKLDTSADGKLYMTASIHGKALRIMVDTGASTLLDIGVARSLGLALSETEMIGMGLTGGSTKRIRATTDLIIGELKIGGMPIDCLDLAETNRLIAAHGLPSFDGLLGAELLGALGAVIDYKHHTLTLTRPGGWF